MGIFISDTMTQAFVATIMSILQMYRHSCLLRLHAAHGLLYGIHRELLLGAQAMYVTACEKNDLGFRHSHTFHCPALLPLPHRVPEDPHFRYLQRPGS